MAIYLGIEGWRVGKISKIVGQLQKQNLLEDTRSLVRDVAGDKNVCCCFVLFFPKEKTFKKSGPTSWRFENDFQGREKRRVSPHGGNTLAIVFSLPGSLFR